jgi:hypothetical protein
MIQNNPVRVGEDEEPKKDADAREKQPVNYKLKYSLEKNTTAYI